MTRPRLFTSSRNHINQSDEKLLLGAVLLISAFFVGTIQNVLVKLIAHQVTISSVVFVQYLVCSIAYLPTMVLKRRTIFKKGHNGLLFMRAIAGLGYFLLMFFALKTTPLTDVALLTNTSPLWVPLICFIILRQPISYHLYISLFIGFLGVIFILVPDGNLASKGAFLALLGGISMAISLVSIKQLAHVESTSRVLIYYFLIGTFTTLPFCILTWKTPSLTSLMIMILNGVLMLTQQTFLYHGFKYGPASKLSISVYSSVIFSALFDWIIWDHSITLSIIIGAILIIFAAMKILFRNSDIKK